MSIKFCHYHPYIVSEICGYMEDSAISMYYSEMSRLHYRYRSLLNIYFIYGSRENWTANLFLFDEIDYFNRFNIFWSFASAHLTWNYPLSKLFLSIKIFINFFFLADTIFKNALANRSSLMTLLTALTRFSFPDYNSS